MYSCGPLHRGEQKQDVQLEHTYSNSVQILDVARKTCQKAMDDREGWREEVRNIRAEDAT